MIMWLYSTFYNRLIRFFYTELGWHLMRYMICLFILAIMSSQPALAATKVALVVGSGGYKGAFQPLDKAENDARLIEKVLENGGFKVIPSKGSSRKELLKAAQKFAMLLKKGGPDTIGFFYYSGHGAASTPFGPNYIIPTNVRKKETSAIWNSAVDVGELVHEIRQLAPDAKLFFIFDACRFAPSDTEDRPVFEFAQTAVPKNTLIAYSMDEGPTASATKFPARGEAGLYATLLAKELAKRGRSANQLFKDLRDKVRLDSPNQQTPWFKTGFKDSSQPLVPKWKVLDLFSGWTN